MEIDLRKLKNNPLVMILVGALGVVALFAGFLFVSSFSTPEAVAEVPTLTPTLLPSPTLTMTPLPTTIPTPIPTAVPQVYIWAADAVGAYLQDKEGTILALVPNGDNSVQLTGETEKWGGVFWYPALYKDQTGWIVADYVHQSVSLPVSYVGNSDGAYLRDAPHGTVLSWLSQGTPIQQIVEEIESDSLTWVKVLLPNETAGWIAGFLLTSEPVTGGDG